MTEYKSPINWYGGKYYMAEDIINLFPEHQIYVEVFGGAGHILFRKQPSDIEVYNDINEGLYLFFKTLRTPDKARRLKNRLDLTPYSREEFYNCRDTWQDETDEIEKVRKWYVTSMQSFSNHMKTWSYTKSKSRRGMAQAVSQWLGKIEENLPDAVDRLKTVQIENLDYKELIKKYDSKDTLFYLDPPYIHDTRKLKDGYEFEMSNEQHKELVDILLHIQGKAVLSGYDHKIYDTLLENGWQKICLGEFAKRAIKTIDKEIEQKGTEYVWVNYKVDSKSEKLA